MQTVGQDAKSAAQCKGFCTANQLHYNTCMQTSTPIPRIVFLDKNGLPERINISRPSQPHQWQDYPNTTSNELLERCRGATVLVTNKVVITRELLAACPTVRHIAVTATGYNVVDVTAAQEHDVSVSHVPSYAANTVAEHVLTCSLVLRRQLNRYRQRVIDGAWQHSPAFCLFDKPIHDLRGAHMGIIGMGEIGQATARLAKAMGMQVSYYSKSEHRIDVASATDLNSLLSNCDIVSIHCSLNQDTHNLIDAAAINAMQPGCLLINTARGGIVDEAATVDAIQRDHLGGIAFDVLVEEPPKDDSPLLSIAGRENVIITPHTAWASEQAMQQLADIVTGNISAFLAGQATNLVPQL